MVPYNAPFKKSNPVGGVKTPPYEKWFYTPLALPLGVAGWYGTQAVPYGIDERIPFNLFSTGGAMSHCPLK